MVGEAEAQCSWKEWRFHMGSAWHSTEGFGPASAFLVTAPFGGQRLDKQLLDACQAFCCAWGKQLSWHHSLAWIQRLAANSLARAGGPSPAGENGARGGVSCSQSCCSVLGVTASRGASPTERAQVFRLAHCLCGSEMSEAALQIPRSA